MHTPSNFRVRETPLSAGARSRRDTRHMNYWSTSTLLRTLPNSALVDFTFLNFVLQLTRCFPAACWSTELFSRKEKFNLSRFTQKIHEDLVSQITSPRLRHRHKNILCARKKIVPPTIKLEANIKNLFRNEFIFC